MKRYYLFLCLYLGFAVSTIIPAYAEQQPSYSILTDSIYKSERDNRQYRVIELQNQLKVLLVSDKQAVKSLASLALPVGSLHDPKTQQGLAHYTEHMVLIGSKKYPQLGGFSEYLSQHAGSFNASTALYRTAFYFEVENSAFDSALDRLVNAIAEPLLDPLYADKERNAVNAELTMARSNDGWGIRQIDAETINQLHPASMFNGGNLETLSDKPDSLLQTELETFYHRYYSSNIMVGVLYSNQSLDQLTSLAIATFSQIKNNHIQVNDTTQTALGSDNVGKFIYMVPVQPKKLLYMQFPIANNIADFKDKSDEYIGYMISNRSPNTLFEKLQQQGLIESISAYADPLYYGNSGVFTIQVSLTDQGLVQTDKVISDVFAYIKLLADKGVQQTYYDELVKVLAQQFKYPDISRDMSYVESLSEQMLYYPAEHVIDADYVATHFNRQAIENRLNSLTINNARIWTIAPNQQTDKVAYFLNTPYRIENIGQQKIDSLLKQGQESNFSLPQLNPYVADNFTIFPQKIETDHQDNSFSPSGNNLHFVSRYFADEPKVSLILSLRNKAALATIDNQIMFNLLDYLANRNLAILNFQANVAGVDITTSADDGLSITLSGFNQHLGDMLTNILATYRDTVITEDNLKLAKSWYLERLAAADKRNSFSLAIQPISVLSMVPYFERNSKKAITATITTKQLQQYRDQLLMDSVPYMLSVGNLTQAQSDTLYQQVKQTLNPQARFEPTKEIVIKQQIDALIENKSENTDSALLMGFLPSHYDRITSRVSSDLLNTIISPWFYDQLRTNEQLGYMVTSLPITVGESSGIGFLIQSNQYDPAYLNSRYQAFYPVISDKLNALTDNEFEQYKQSIINEQLMPPQTLQEEFAEYLSDYYRSSFDFASKQQKIDRIAKLTKSELVAFYRQAVIEPTGLAIASAVLGQQNDKTINGITGFTLYQGASELQKVLLTH